MEDDAAVNTPPASPAAPQMFVFTSPSKTVSCGRARSPGKSGTLGLSSSRNRCASRVQVGLQADADATNPDAGLHEALKIVLEYETCIKTLVKCTALSQHFCQHIHNHTQKPETARTLLASWKQSMPQKPPALPQKQRMVSTGFKEQRLQCLLWLCRTAGVKFVNSHDVACSLLDVFREEPDFVPERLLAGLKEAGLELTAALLLYACKAQLPDVPFTVRRLDRGSSLSLHAHRVLALQKDKARPSDDVLLHVRGVLPHVTAANLPDLLLITLSYSPIELAADAATLLLDYDRDSLHLLHTNKAQGITMGAAVPAQPAVVASSAGGDSGVETAMASVDGVAYIRQANDNEAVAQYIAQLMEACALSGNLSILYRLLKVPTAQNIGTPTVLDLLQAAIKGPAPGAWKGLQIVTSLPAAQEISSDAIAALLAEAIAHRVRSVAPLLQLPDARMLEAKFALEMLPKAVEAGLGGVAAELGRFAAGREPETADIVSLLRILVSSPWCREHWTMDPLLRRHAPVSGGYSFCQCFMDFCCDPTTLGLWSKLTGEDVLQLLEYCTSRGYGYAWNDLMRLPTVVNITNVPRFIACFKAALQTASPGESVSWPAHLPAASRLKPSQFYDIVQCALQSPMHTVPEGLLKAVSRMGKPDPQLGPNWADEPAAHAWNAAQVQELMTLAANVDKGTSVDWEAITMLAKCPAAHKVTPQALTAILQQLLSSLDDHANRKLNRREHMLQHCVAALSLVARDRGAFVRQMGFGSSGGIQLATVHKEALLCLAALRPIKDVQPEQLPQAESVGSKPLTWAAVMYILTRQPAAQQWSVECVQQALGQALGNVRPDPVSEAEHNANELLLSLFINLVRLPAAQKVSAAGVQAMLQHARATGGVFESLAVQRKLALLPGYAAVIAEMDTAASNIGDGAGLNSKGSGSGGEGLVGWLARRFGGI